MNKIVNIKDLQPIQPDLIKLQIRNAIDSMYDVQSLRIATGNRICASFRLNKPEVYESYVKKGKGTDELEDKNASVDSVLSVILKEYKSVNAVYTEVFMEKGRVDKAIDKLHELVFIKTKMDYDLMSTYVTLLDLEKSYTKIVKNVVEEHPMWDKFFLGVKGCGTVIAGICIAYLDVHEARHVSSFWSYAGVGTRDDGEGNRVAMDKFHLVEVEYEDSDGNLKTKKSLGYNRKLQSKLLSLFVGSVLKSGKDNYYAKCYYDYKNRYANRADLQGASAMRIHRMASRQCVKAFLRDLWIEWRSFEGYELSRPYEEEYLGRAIHKYNEAHSRKATV